MLVRSVDSEWSGLEKVVRGWARGGRGWERGRASHDSVSGRSEPLLAMVMVIQD